MTARPTIYLKLDRNMVAVPVQRAAMVSIDVVAAAMTAFAGSDLVKPSMPNQFVRFRFRGPEMTSDERRSMYENWLLAKGFHDLARGIRESLEEAAVYLGIIANPPTRIPTTATLEDLFASYRKTASKLLFPKLLAWVNARLTVPLEFEREFLSIQKVRNCMEHRAGIVRKQDLDGDEAAFTLRFPHLKIFYMRRNAEIEISPDERVNAEDDQPEVQILGRIESRSRIYQPGEQITFTSDEFTEIARACSFFGRELADKLPAISTCSQVAQT
jgi:hypothetical protein